jgi:hypothetical protein
MSFSIASALTFVRDQSCVVAETPYDMGETLEPSAPVTSCHLIA